MEKRKAFSFLRSYYDVLDDIHSDKDKLTYLMAILDKQFKGIEPELSGIPRLCYNGQRHSIEKSVEGWENKTGMKLFYPTEGPTEGGSQGPTEGPTEGPYQPPAGDSVMTTEGPTEGPYQQEKEKGKEEEKEQEKKKNKNKNLILEDEKFYNHNLHEVHHIMDTLKVSKYEAIEMHKEFLNSMNSIFK